MDILRPPTDNLYKFVALTGFVLVIVSLGLPLVTTWDIERRVARTKAKARWSMTKMWVVAPKAERASNLVTKMNAAGDTASDSTVAAWQQEIEALDLQRLSDRSQFERERLLDFISELQDITADNAESKILLRRLKAINRFTSIGLIVGLLLTISGFVLWYYKTQRHQDSILQDRASPGSRHQEPE